MFEAGNFRFGLELRKQVGGDGGLAIHVLADLAGTPGRTYMEETELLAFDCFREAPHYHYGPRNKNHRIFWDKTLVPDPLEWTLEQFKSGKLRDMIQRAGYPGVAADYDAGCRVCRPAGVGKAGAGNTTPNRSLPNLPPTWYLVNQRRRLTERAVSARVSEGPLFDPRDFMIADGIAHLCAGGEIGALGAGMWRGTKLNNARTRNA